MNALQIIKLFLTRSPPRSADWVPPPQQRSKRPQGKLSGLPPRGRSSGSGYQPKYPPSGPPPSRRRRRIDEWVAAKFEYAEDYNRAEETLRDLDEKLAETKARVENIRAGGERSMWKTERTEYTEHCVDRYGNSYTHERRE